MDKPRKFVEPDSLLAEICNRLAAEIISKSENAGDPIFIKEIIASDIRETVERVCAEWYANLPDRVELHQVEVQPSTCACGGGLGGELGSHAINCARSEKGS